MVFGMLYLKVVSEKPPQIDAGGRRDQVVLSRCCIGHSQPTHAFLLRGNPPPECIGSLTLTLDCIYFLAPCQQLYSAGNMHDLVSKVKQEILAFLRIAGLSLPLSYSPNSQVNNVRLYLIFYFPWMQIIYV